MFRSSQASMHCRSMSGLLLKLCSMRRLKEVPYMPDSFWYQLHRHCRSSCNWCRIYICIPSYFRSDYVFRRLTEPMLYRSMFGLLSQLCSTMHLKEVPYNSGSVWYQQHRCFRSSCSSCRKQNGIQSYSMSCCMLQPSRDTRCCRSMSGLYAKLCSMFHLPTILYIPNSFW